MMNEEKFTQHLAGLFSKRSDVFTGIGDDAAALDLGLPDGKLLLAAADQVVEDIHFLPATPAADAAKKLLNRNVSDIAAMGGIPTHALVTLALNPLDPAWMEDFHASLEQTAKSWGLSVIGGDFAALPRPGKQASLSIFGLVEKDRICLRENAKPGDRLYLTGSFGRSFPTGHHLHFHPRVDEARFLAGTYTHAMMDVSDGLAKDLSRFAATSGLTVRITEPDAIPRRDHASLEESLNDGEDYELLIAVPEERAADLEKNWPFPDTPLTHAGYFESGAQGALFVQEQRFHEKGYDHFHENQDH